MMEEPLDANRLRSDPPRLHTVVQFQRKLADYGKGIRIGLAAFAATMAVYYTAFFAIFFSILPEQEGPPQPLAVIVFVLFFLGNLLIIGAFDALADRFKIRYQYPCPYCVEPLDVVSDFYFAIAIHGCPHCYNPLFQEWSDHSAIMPPPAERHSALGEITFADIAEAKKKRKPVIVKGIIIATIVAIVVLGLTSAALWAWHDLMQARFGDLAADVAHTIRFTSTFLTFAIGFFFACFRPPGVLPQCGGCGNRLIDVGYWTRATGNCTVCGRRVIRDAPILRSDDDRSGCARIEHTQLAKWKAQFTRRVICSIFVIIGLGALAWSWLITWWFGVAWNQPVSFGFVVLTSAGWVVLILVLGRLVHLLEYQRCCPYCKASLLGHTDLIHATGNCLHCGRRVMKSAGSIER